MLRVQALLRRSRSDAGPDASGEAPLSDGDLVVDRSARRTLLDGAEVSLTAREYDLLCHFLRHPGQAWSREDLMREVWGWDFGDTSTVTVHVRRLREKIEPDPAAPRRLVTVWGVGYRWDAHPGAA